MEHNLSFLKLSKTFSLGHRKTTLFPHSYFISVCNILINVHHYDNKYIGLNRSENKHSCFLVSQLFKWGKQPGDGQVPTTEGPGVHLPRAAQQRGRGEGGRWRWPRCHMTLLLPCFPDYFYDPACKWLRGHPCQCFWQGTWHGTTRAKNGFAAQDNDSFYSEIDVCDFLLNYKQKRMLFIQFCFSVLCKTHTLTITCPIIKHHHP